MATNASDAVQGRSGETPNAWHVSGRALWWAIQLAPFVLAFAAYSAAFVVMRPVPTGDEPHYLMAAQSIAYDGDLDLRNDYSSRERTLNIGVSFPLSPNLEAAVFRDSGQLRPIHGIGLSLPSPRRSDSEG